VFYEFFGTLFRCSDHSLLKCVSCAELYSHESYIHTPRNERTSMKQLINYEGNYQFFTRRTKRYYGLADLLLVITYGDETFHMKLKSPNIIKQ